MLQLWESIELKVSGAGVAVKTVRKWRAEVEVDEAESCLHLGVLRGTVTRGRTGLGVIAPPRYEKEWGKWSGVGATS